MYIYIYIIQNAAAVSLPFLLGEGESNSTKLSSLDFFLNGDDILSCSSSSSSSYSSTAFCFEFDEDPLLLLLIMGRVYVVI